MADDLSSNLLDPIQQDYEVDIKKLPIRLDGGYECDVWRVGDYVVRVCPEWRSEAELKWTYDFVEQCADTVPEVIAPIKTQSGENFILHDGRAVLLFPYIEGHQLDLANNDLLWQSAQILAKIHLASDYLPEDSERPPSKDTAPRDEPGQLDPKSIQDPDLDVWYNQFIQRDDLTLGMTHGDYYRGNILCLDSQVAGVIDWDECDYGVLIRELAWATWEMCHTDDGENLDTQKAARFLYAYLQIHPAMTHEMTAIVPLIRYHLRYEIRRSLALEEAGHGRDDDYRQAEIRDFNNLKTLIFTIF